MKSNLVRLILTLLFLAACASNSLTAVLADGSNPYPPICPTGPCDPK